MDTIQGFLNGLVKQCMVVYKIISPSDILVKLNEYRYNY